MLVEQDPRVTPLSCSTRSIVVRLALTYRMGQMFSSFTPSVFADLFFSSRRRHTRSQGDWSSDVCSSDLGDPLREAAHVVVDPEDLLEQHDTGPGPLTGGNGAVRLEHSPVRRGDGLVPRHVPSSMTATGWPAPTTSSVSTRNSTTVPATPALTGWKFFMTSMRQTVSSAVTSWPSSTNGSLAGSGRRYKVPGIGEMTS